MTKSETLQALADKLGKTRKEAGEIMDAIIALAVAETKKSGEFTFPAWESCKRNTEQPEWAEIRQLEPLSQFQPRPC